jgi:hypothetical protein
MDLFLFLLQDLKKAETDERAALMAMEGAQQKLTDSNTELEKAKFNNNPKLIGSQYSYSLPLSVSLSLSPSLLYSLHSHPIF